MNNIPNKIKEYRIKAGLTQFDVMLKLGVKSTDRISKWECGSKYPSMMNLLKLAKILDVQARELYPEIGLSQTPLQDPLQNLTRN